MVELLVNGSAESWELDQVFSKAELKVAKMDTLSAAAKVLQKVRWWDHSMVAKSVERLVSVMADWTDYRWADKWVEYLASLLVV